MPQTVADDYPRSPPPPLHPKIESQTPIARRILSICYSDHPTPLTVDKLDKLLDMELSDAIHDNQKLVELVFPNGSLPFIVDTKLLKSLGQMYSKGCWTKLPEITPSSESTFAKWMNAIGIY